MKIIPLYSINAKIVVVLALTITIIFIISTIVGFEISDKLLKDRMKNQLTSESHSRGNAIENLIAVRTQIIDSFARNAYIHSIMYNSITKSPESYNQIYLEHNKVFLEEVERLQKTFHSSLGLVHLHIVENNGNVLYSTDKPNSYSLESLGIVDMHKSVDFIRNNEGSRQMVVYSPIMTSPSSETNLGFVIANLDVKQIDNILLNREGLGNTGEVYLVNEDYVLISESRFVKGAAFEQQVNTMGVIECFENGTNVSDIYLDYRGITIFGHGYCARDMGFVLLAEIDEAEIFEPLTELQNIILITSIASSIFVGIIALFISKTISTPIGKLRKAADTITGGDYHHEIKVDSNDEIGQLARHLEKMRKSILKTIQDLKSTEIRLEQSLKRNKVDSEIIHHQMSELKIANEELINKERLKDEFLSMTSHELKTPLTPIMGWCDALKDPEIIGNLTAEQCEAVDAIEANAERLKILIDDMLDIQKIELQQFEIRDEDVDVNKICEQIERDFSFMIKEKHGQLQITCDKIPAFRSDVRRIIQVLSALLYNSIDYIPEKDGKIHLTVKEENNRILFSVEDNGPGIAKHLHRSLFKKFYQIDISHTRHHGGTGLGLAISKGIVELLGGRIWVESELGNGAKFIFTLPRRG